MGVPGLTWITTLRLHCLFMAHLLLEQLMLHVQERFHQVITLLEYGIEIGSMFLQILPAGQYRILMMIALVQVTILVIIQAATLIVLMHTHTGIVLIFHNHFATGIFSDTCGLFYTFKLR